MYKIRVILDTKEDVIRTIAVDKTINLEELHFSIAKAFGFGGQEMASFYRTDDEWNQGEEIPLFDMADAGVDSSMANHNLQETLLLENEKLIYVYDFMKMWTFYVELIEIAEEKIANLHSLILSVGEIPAKAPEKEFLADENESDFDEEFNDDDEYDSYEDEYDFN
jgi:hypothetical protein